MFIQVCAIDAGPRQGQTPMSKDLGIQRKRKPTVLSFMMLAFVSLTFLIAGVIMFARLGTPARIVELPQRYLPGNPIPDDTLCTMPINQRVTCAGNYLGKRFEVIYDMASGTISYTVMVTPEYTLGDLIVAWGTPTGITQTACCIHVYWGTQYAFLFATSFRPDDKVELIGYALRGQRTSRWRGFTRRKN